MKRETSKEMALAAEQLAEIMDVLEELAEDDEESAFLLNRVIDKLNEACNLLEG